MLECKGWVLSGFGVVTIEVKVLLGVCGFVVDICDDLVIFVFMRMSENSSSLEVCSIGNFILGFCLRILENVEEVYLYLTFMLVSLGRP